MVFYFVSNSKYWKSMYTTRGPIAPLQVEGHQTIIYANLQLNLSSNFWWEIFQRMNMHYNGEKPSMGLNYQRSNLVLAILVDGHQKITYANLHSNLSSSFWEENFKIMNIQYYRKNSPTPVGAYLMKHICFTSFGTRLLDDHFMPVYTKICLVVSEKKIFKELISILIRKTAPPL